jgi:hypothetical protein
MFSRILAMPRVAAPIAHGARQREKMSSARPSRARRRWKAIAEVGFDLFVKLLELLPDGLDLLLGQAMERVLRAIGRGRGCGSVSVLRGGGHAASW